MTFKKLFSLMVLTTVMLGFGVQTARADSINFDLGLGNAAISGYPSPYANVDVNLIDSTHAVITFTRLGTDRLGSQGVGGVNVNASSWTVGGLGSSGVLADLTNGGGGNEDGWGAFNQTFNNFDGLTHSLTSFNFTLTNTSGTWASASNVLTGNANGYRAAAHIFIVTADGSNPATGFATEGGTSVPDGGTTASLLGLALGAGALVARRRK